MYSILSARGETPKGYPRFYNPG